RCAPIRLLRIGTGYTKPPKNSRRSMRLVVVPAGRTPRRCLAGVLTALGALGPARWLIVVVVRQQHRRRAGRHRSGDDRAEQVVAFASLGDGRRQEILHLRQSCRRYAEWPDRLRSAGRRGGK